MANIKQIYHKNVDGDYFVDTTCIDCGTCYWMAPKTFQRIGNQSAVYQQPTIEDDHITSYQALLSCPTNSIGVTKRHDIFTKAVKDLPLEIADGVYHTGYHSEKSFGATSYLIRSKNEVYLIDSPRLCTPVVKTIQAWGGLTAQLFTHKDDLADADHYHEKFSSPRYIHEDDRNHRSDHYEYFWKGQDPIALNSELLVIPVPGHTKGHVVFLYQKKFLFTGDHLAFSQNLGQLYAFSRHCWYDWSKQIKSMERLLDYEFEYVLPGHSAPYKADKATMAKAMQKCVQWMKAEQ